MTRKVSMLESSGGLFGHSGHRQLPTYGGSNPDRDDGINSLIGVEVDDMLLERNERSLGNFSFFGLALVCGAIGMMATTQTSVGAETVSQQKDLYLGRGLRSNSAAAGESCPMSDESCQLTLESYPEMSAFDNLEMALYLIKEALSQLPYMAYLSFMLSLTFLFLFVQPYFFGSSKAESQK